MAKKKFKAESKRLLDLMIHSIYTNKEIFLRELISNASDATDKRYYQTVQAGGEALNRDDLPISISIDKDARTLTIEDHGCGMTAEELENNLGTIAQSGSLEFKEGMEESDDVDIIGQFGVGFYSAFMVADKLVVTSRSTEDDTAHVWTSEGVEGYVIAPAEKEEVGTKIEILVKENTDDDNYDEFLDDYHVRGLIRKHSDYIRYPIRMDVEKMRDKEGGEEGETESYTEEETLNSMTPIWKRQRSEVTEEEYNQFYKDKFFDYSDPLKTIYTSTEGVATYNALLFVPSRLPMNYHSKEYQKGLQLYASGVLIMEHCADLLPDYFGFIRGVVDSQDLSLNISREMLQQDRQLTFMAGRLEKKIQSELISMQKNERENYNKMYESFGVSLKYGVYESYGAKADLLKELLMFKSSSDDEYTTLREYLDRMREDQKYIYYASGDNLTQLKNLPAAEAIKEKGYEILYFTDQVDEFTIKMLNTYEEKEFRSITGGDLGLETEEEQKVAEEKSKEHAGLLDYMKEALGEKVSAVQISPRLKNHPVCLTTKGDLSLEMEKILSAMPGSPGAKAERVLELNVDHPVFSTLGNLLETDKDKLNAYTEILYNQSLLLEGLAIEDPVAYTDAVSKLLV